MGPPIAECAAVAVDAALSAVRAHRWTIEIGDACDEGGTIGFRRALRGDGGRQKRADGGECESCEGRQVHGGAFRNESY